MQRVACIQSAWIKIRAKSFLTFDLVLELKSFLKKKKPKNRQSNVVQASFKLAV